MAKAGEAMAKINQALQVDPQNLTALFNAGLALRRLGRYKASMARLQTLLQSHPYFPAAQYQMGYDYFEERKYSQAVSSFARVAELLPGNPDVHNGLRVALAESGQTAPAAQQVAQALRLAASNAVYQRNLACIQRPARGCELTP